MMKYNIFSKTVSFLTLVSFIFSACSLTPSQGISRTENGEENLQYQRMPLDSSLYYGRSLLNGDSLKAYDFILAESLHFKANAEEYNDIYHRLYFNLIDENIYITREELNRVLNHIMNDDPRLYTMHPVARIETYQGSFVARMYVGFRSSTSDTLYIEEIEKIYQNTDKILENILPGMTEAQKVRVIHDEFIKLVRYSMLLGHEGDLRGAFINFRIVCEGYARGLLFLLQRAGILGIYIAGDTPQGMHAWNKVRIDGQWYNIDPTWNDPVFGVDAEVIYDYFLKNDAEFHINHTPKTGTYGYAVLPDSADQSYALSDTEFVVH